MAKPNFNTQQAGAQITREDRHWGATLGQGGDPISFGFWSTEPGYVSSDHNNLATFTRMTAVQMAAAETALRMWASVSNITFAEVNNGGYTDDATILFGNYFSATDASAAFALPPGGTAANDSAGDVWVNTKSQSTTSVPNGGYDYTTLLHEIGHALGLQHPGDYNAAPGVEITYGAEDGVGNNTYIQDSLQYTLKSYFDADNTGADHVYDMGDADPDTNQIVYASTPLLHDIAAIQRLYGANYNTRAGDSVYGFFGNTGQAYDITSNTVQVVFAVWDGGGDDWLNFSGYTQNQRIDLGAGKFSDVGALTKNVAIAEGVDIENAVGGSGNDNITGNTGDNYLSGGSGSDKLFGLEGADRLYGGSGNDLLAGGYGFIDKLYGGADDDLYIVNDLDIITEFANEGYDTVESQFRTVLSANVEQLILTGTRNVNGFGNELDNWMSGNAGNNYLQGFGGVDLLLGGKGNDYYELGDTHAPSIFAVWSFDTIREEADEGVDTVSVSSEAVGGVIINAYTLGNNLENGIVTGALSFNLTGNGLGNALTGNSGINTLSGLNGNDTLNGKAGRDTLAGGIGNDTYILDDLTFLNSSSGSVYDTVVEALNAGIDKVLVMPRGNGSYYLDLNVEQVEVTGNSGLNVIGNDLGNLMLGSGGYNSMFGLGGNDVLDGRGGLDDLAGGMGDDVYYLADANFSGGAVFGALKYDTIIEDVDAGTDLVVVYSLAGPLSYSMAANVENVTIADGGNFSVSGNNLGNLLRGNASRNGLSGNGGNDTLVGGGDLDTLAGGLGNDSYFLNDVTSVGGVLEFDTVTEAAGGGVDRVLVSSTLGRSDYVLGANVENATVTGRAAFSLNGNGLNNTLAGNGAANVLVGGGGDDVLIGAAGRDTMLGGVGFDQFLFSAITDSGMSAETRDVILGFELGIDRISLALIDAIEADGEANDAFVFLAGGAVIDAAGQVSVVQAGLHAMVLINTGGTEVAEASILLMNVTAASLTADDFIL